MFLNYYYCYYKLRDPTISEPKWPTKYKPSIILQDIDVRGVEP